MTLHRSMLCSVLSDQYRYTPSQFDRNRLDEWQSWSDTPPNSRVRMFALASWRSLHQNVLANFLFGFRPRARTRHYQGARDSSKSSAEQEGFWRCENCGRIHLHRAQAHARVATVH